MTATVTPDQAYPRRYARKRRRFTSPLNHPDTARRASELTSRQNTRHQNPNSNSRQHRHPTLIPPA